LGAPMEYLNLRWIEHQGRWTRELSDLTRYWRTLQTLRTSPNGVFSYKMFVSNYFTVQDRCPALLASLAPTHVVFLTRNDIVAQAVSYARAIKSQHWFNHGGYRVRLEYDRSSIERALAMAVNQQLRWERIFALTEADVLRVSYEEYLEDRAGTVAKVIRYVCGPGEAGSDMGLPNIELQRDISSYEWIERYNTECAATVQQRLAQLKADVRAMGARQGFRGSAMVTEEPFLA
jgi:trehalose 2-sulfotransferase